MLAERFGVSRTPVREALRVLQAMGVVVLMPQRGAFVRAPTATEIRGAYAVRFELEGLAAQLAAERRARPNLPAWHTPPTQHERVGGASPATVLDDPDKPELLLAAAAASRGNVAAQARWNLSPSASRTTRRRCGLWRTFPPADTTRRCRLHPVPESSSPDTVG